ncbi:MAG: hypothetical protein HY527_09530 [Betaproteobacteria bacterium]|nr:hypothetical protein [Betaproteobacteria bacterium]
MKQPQVRYKRHRSAAAHDARTRKQSAQEEKMLDDALDQTFPASDPLALTMPHAAPGSKDSPRKH